MFAGQKRKLTFKNFRLDLILTRRKMKLVALFLLSLAVLTAADDKKEGSEDLGTVIGIDLGTTYSWYGLYLLVHLSYCTQPFCF